MRFLNCSFIVFPDRAGSVSIAFLTYGIIAGTFTTSWAARVVKNLVALPRSPSPLLKKKLAPSWPFKAKDWATVLAMVGMVHLPVPAIPFSQNIDLLWGSWAHSVI